MKTETLVPDHIAKLVLMGFYGIVRKEIIRIIRIWPQTLLPSAITMILYFLIFGKVIGSRVGEMAGIPYMLYITPGLIMMPVITNSYTNVVSSFFGARIVNRSIEELLVSPMPNWAIVFGYVVGGMFRGLVVAIVVMVVAMIFTGLHCVHPILTILGLILSSLFFATAGFLNGMFARNFDDTSIVATFILTPLIYLGGVFYSVKTLSPFWQGVSLFNPIHYVIDFFRFAVLGVNNIDAYWALSLIILMNVVIITAVLVCMHKGYGIKQ